MPVYFVGKGHQFQIIDEQFNSGDRKVYEDALERISRTPSLVALAGQHVASSPLTQGDVDHLRDDWFGSWWPDLPVEDVLRAGYRQAIDRAKNANKPIDSIWVCAKEDQFQVYICESEHQVTVIVFTPPPPEQEDLPGERAHSREQLDKNEPIWVVKKRDDWDDKYTEQANDPYSILDEANEIIVRRIRYAGA
jgi:hypothetical protein